MSDKKASDATTDDAGDSGENAEGAVALTLARRRERRKAREQRQAALRVVSDSAQPDQDTAGKPAGGGEQQKQNGAKSDNAQTGPALKTPGAGPKRGKPGAAATPAGAPRQPRGAGQGPGQAPPVHGKAPAQQKPKPIPPGQPDAIPPKPGAKPGAAKTPSVSYDAISRRKSMINAARRRKSFALLTRILLFVLGPAILVGYYLYNFATPFYESESAFIIQSSEVSSVPSVGGLMSMIGGGGGGMQDALIVEEHILSRQVMDRLDSDHGFIAHFQTDEVDLLRRLQPDATREEAYDYYLSKVRIDMAPTESMLHLSVQARTPEDAKRFADALIQYSEEKVNEISERMREDQLAGAQREIRLAEENMRKARENIVRLQQEFGQLDPLATAEADLAVKQTLEQRLAETRAKLQALATTGAQRTTAADNLRAEIDALEQEKSTFDARANQNREAIAAFQQAQFELLTAQAIFESALASLEQARIETLRQHRYLSLSVEPSAPDEARYPEIWRVTALVFLISLLVMNVLSLTIAMVREHARI